MPAYNEAAIMKNNVKHTNGITNTNITIVSSRDLDVDIINQDPVNKRIKDKNIVASPGAGEKRKIHDKTRHPNPNDQPTRAGVPSLREMLLLSLRDDAGNLLTSTAWF